MLNVRPYIPVRSYASWRVRDIHCLAHRTSEVNYNAFIIAQLISRLLFVWMRPVVNYICKTPNNALHNFRAPVHNLAHSQRRYRMKGASMWPKQTARYFDGTRGWTHNITPFEWIFEGISEFWFFSFLGSCPLSNDSGCALWLHIIISKAEVYLRALVWTTFTRSWVQCSFSEYDNTDRSS